MIAPGGLILVAMLAAGAADRAPAFRPEVVMAGSVVTLGDVADLSSLPPELQSSAAGLPLARFAPGQDHMTFAAARLAERARALAPALAPWLSTPGETRVSVRLASLGATRAIAASCLRVARPVVSGDFPVRADFEPADCGAAVTRAAFRYDTRSGAARAVRNLVPGETIAVSASALPDVRPGQKLYVHARIGAVSISREVEAVQPARPGQAVFVRGSNGTVFPVALSDVDR